MAVTDGYLMDADCIHGNVWWECRECGAAESAIPPDGIFDPESGYYITGTGQTLTRIHPADRCAGETCVIHHPSDHTMRAMPTYWRIDRGIMERLCSHGVGHPDPDSPWPPDSFEWVHGCDGCCR